MNKTNIINEFRLSQELRESLLEEHGVTTEFIVEHENQRNESLDMVVELGSHALEIAVQSSKEDLELCDKLISDVETLDRLEDNEDFLKLKEMYYIDERDRVSGTLASGSPFDQSDRDDMVKILDGISLFRRFISNKFKSYEQAKADAFGHKIDIEFHNHALELSKKGK